MDRQCSGLGASRRQLFYTNLMDGDETPSIATITIPSAVAVFLGHNKTIKELNISLKCFRFFSKLETGV